MPHSSMTATEAERQYYLSRMGVQLWYARAPLPGAAPSPDFDFSEPETPEGASPAEAGASRPSRHRPDQATLPPGKSVKELLQSIGDGPNPSDSGPAKTSTTAEADVAAPQPEVPAPDSAPERSPESVPEADEASSVLANIRTDMGIWWGQRIALVSPMSTDVSEDLQAKLAANILRALGDTDVEQKRLVWPVFNNPRVLKSADRDLRMILRSLADQVGERQLLCLGVLSEDPEQHRALVEGLSGKIFDAPDPLAALAGDHEKKRSLWHRLQDRVTGAR
ncbi:hypothetical protein EZI54_10060 [Marinobacter halodurans]|uniref:2-isopropylmalate synthase n=1 Tax=Marinobacter halodurans TaxID=2528979 RepID=A0ABY1ZQ43_9GAMM|nr:hypothetical protein [Marinobacter halodurans]TBW56278.1 hypothetical protein EZI54_10060 [Marinobacter halodurans]